jgi:hypothetical protein
MITERDIWLAAKAMIDRYGNNAGIEAARRADELLEEGDGYAIWKQIIAAIDKLQAEKRSRVRRCSEKRAGWSAARPP